MIAQEEAERKVLEGRRDADTDNRGNEQIMEDDGRPVYPGLEMEIQDKLADFLVEAADQFINYDFEDTGAEA